ncbi:MAG: hypothetical protein AB7I38_10975 [Dehalococcoidia bacterium]
MNIFDVHDYLAETFLPGIEITDPVAAEIERAYPTVPDLNRALTDLPCAMLPTHELQSVQFRSAFIEKQYAVNLQLFVKRVDVEQGLSARIASAFEDAIILACSGAMRLGGNASVIRGVRGERETLVRLEWAGEAFVGLDMWIDVTLKETRAHSA